MYSSRAQAFLLLSMIPALRDLRMGLIPGSSKADRELARRLLSSAQWVLDAYPELPTAIDSIIGGMLGPVAPTIARLINSRPPRDDKEALQHALTFAGWAMLYHPPLRAELEAYFMQLIIEAPDYPDDAPKTAKTTIKQSSNQVAEATAEAINKLLESIGRPPAIPLNAASSLRWHQK